MVLFPAGGLAATKKLIIDYIGTAEQQFENDLFASVNDVKNNSGRSSTVPGVFSQ